MAEVVLRMDDGDKITTVADDLPAGVRVPVFDHMAPCDGFCGKRVCSGHPQFGAITYHLTGERDAQGRPVVRRRAVNADGYRATRHPPGQRVIPPSAGRPSVP